MIACNLSKQSLHKHYPEAWYLPLLMVGSLLILLCALFLPVMRVEKLVFWKDDYSVLMGVKELFLDGSWVLGIILFLFSVVFPIGKLLLLIGLWFWQVDTSQRANMLQLLGRLSRWSMLDVFVVALMIVLSKGSGILDVEPRIGVYLFGTAVIASTLLSESVKRKHQDTPEAEKGSA